MSRPMPANQFGLFGFNGYVFVLGLLWLISSGLAQLTVWCDLDSKRKQVGGFWSDLLLIGVQTKFYPWVVNHLWYSKMLAKPSYFIFN